MFKNAVTGLGLFAFAGAVCTCYTKISGSYADVPLTLDRLVHSKGRWTGRLRGRQGAEYPEEADDAVDYDNVLEMYQHHGERIVTRRESCWEDAVFSNAWSHRLPSLYIVLYDTSKPSSEPSQ